MKVSFLSLCVCIPFEAHLGALSRGPIPQVLASHIASSGKSYALNSSGGEWTKGGSHFPKGVAKRVDKRRHRLHLINCNQYAHQQSLSVCFICLQCVHFTQEYNPY